MELKVVFSGEISIRNSENVNPHGLEIFSSKCFFEINALLIQDLIIIWCRVQYYKYFPSCSLFTNFFVKLLGNMRNKENIFDIIRRKLTMSKTLHYISLVKLAKKYFSNPGTLTGMYNTITRYCIISSWNKVFVVTKSFSFCFFISGNLPRFSLH